MTPPLPPIPDAAARARSRMRLARTVGALLIAFGLGAAVDRVVGGRRPAETAALAPPGPVATLRDGAAAAVRGQVVDVFGSRFVISDPTGKALVETGPAGEGRTPVVSGETVAVTGRFERGVLHATSLAHADGRLEAVGPLRGPDPRRGRGWLRAIF